MRARPEAEHIAAQGETSPAPKKSFCGNRVGGGFPPSSHTTVRTVRYTAVPLLLRRMTCRVWLRSSFDDKRSIILSAFRAYPLMAATVTTVFCAFFYLTSGNCQFHSPSKGSVLPEFSLSTMTSADFSSLSCGLSAPTRPPRVLTRSFSPSICLIYREHFRVVIGLQLVWQSYPCSWPL